MKIRLRRKSDVEALAAQMLAGTERLSRWKRNRFYVQLGRADYAEVLQAYYRLKRES